VVAEQAGAKIVIINITPTPADRIADIVINASAGDVLGRIIGEVKQRLHGCV
jgi:hypothetical protein